MQSKLIQTQPSNSVSLNQRIIATFPAPDLAFLIIISFMLLSAIAVPIYAYIPKSPCHGCRYFSRNSYLKCTVHPVSILTKQAIDCADYSQIIEANGLNSR